MSARQQRLEITPPLLHAIPPSRASSFRHRMTEFVLRTFPIAARSARPVRYKSSKAEDPKRRSSAGRVSPVGSREAILENIRRLEAGRASSLCLLS